MRTKSKFLSLILRHKPETIGLTLDKNGYGDVNYILDKLEISLDDLENIVNDNNKKRFEFNEDKTLIRARQGHSVNVDVELTEVEIDEKLVLYHGTPTKNIFNIINMKQGLKKGSRLHVHLTTDLKTARETAKRYAKDITILKIYFNGDEGEPKLYKSNNNVYLSDNIPYWMISKNN